MNIIFACHMTDPKVSDVAVSNGGHVKRREKHMPEVR